MYNRRDVKVTSQLAFPAVATRMNKLNVIHKIYPNIVYSETLLSTNVQYFQVHLNLQNTVNKEPTTPTCYNIINNAKKRNISQGNLFIIVSGND